MSAKEPELMKTYLKAMINNIPADYLLDYWWQYLADKKIWCPRAKEKDPSPKPVKLESLDTSYLYNIIGCIMRASPNPYGVGATRLVGLITRLIQEKAEEAEKHAEIDEEDIPF